MSGSTVSPDTGAGGDVPSSAHGAHAVGTDGASAGTAAADGTTATADGASTADGTTRAGARTRTVPDSSTDVTPVLEGRGIVKTYGRVVALDAADFALFPGEVLAVIGDNGAGKSSLIKCLSGAEVPDSGDVLLEGREVHFRRPIEAKAAGIETVYQTLAVAPALDIASNLYLGREERKPGILGSVFRMLDGGGMRRKAKDQMTSLGIGTLQNMGQTVETLSGGQRQAVSVARAAAFASKVIILDEPTAALGVRETNQVLKLIESLRDRGMPVILISHNMPNVFQVADRIHVQRLGRRAAVVSPSTINVTDAVAIMTGALQVPFEEQQLTPVRR